MNMKVGEVYRICLPGVGGDTVRHGRVVEIDRQGQMAYVRWSGYSVGSEWVRFDCIEA